MKSELNVLVGSLAASNKSVSEVAAWVNKYVNTPAQAPLKAAVNARRMAAL